MQVSRLNECIGDYASTGGLVRYLVSTIRAWKVASTALEKRNPVLLSRMVILCAVCNKAAKCTRVGQLIFPIAEIWNEVLPDFTG